jgi:uncharacterized membrane protein HdeD (DUF308 family)
MLTALAAQNWAMFVIRGVLAIALGTLIFVAPGPSLAALILVFAIYAIVDGLFATILGLAVPFASRWLFVVGGVLAIALGVYTLANPGITATALAIVIGAFAIVRGGSEVAFAVSLRRQIPDAWLYVISGIVSVLFGAYLVAVPSDGIFAVLFVIGWYALFAGVMYVAMGVRLRGLNQELSAPTTQAKAAS